MEFSTYMPNMSRDEIGAASENTPAWESDAGSMFTVSHCTAIHLGPRQKIQSAVSYEGANLKSLTRDPLGQSAWAARTKKRRRIIVTLLWDGPFAALRTLWILG